MSRGSDIVSHHLRSLATYERDVNLILLTWVAGSIDAISYFELGRVFTANMTGNTVLLGLAIAQGQILESLRSGAALLGFAAGAALGTVIVGRDRKKGEWPPIITFAVVIETVLVGIFAVVSRIAGIQPNGTIVYPLIILFGVAMGLQSVSVRHLEVAGVATTYLTGTLTSLVVGMISWIGSFDLSSMGARKRGPSNSEGDKKGSVSDVRLLIGVYLIYFVAAISGGYVELHTQHWAVILPLTALIFVVINAVFHHYH